MNNKTVYYRAFTRTNKMVKVELNMGWGCAPRIRVCDMNVNLVTVGTLSPMELIRKIPDIARFMVIEKAGNRDEALEIWTFIEAENLVEVQRLGDGLISIMNIWPVSTCGAPDIETADVQEENLFMEEIPFDIAEEMPVIHC